MMKKNKKLLTLILAGACCATAVAGAALTTNISASADKTLYKISDVFSKNGEASYAAENGFTKFELKKDSDYVSFNNSLPLKWYAAKNDVKYFSTVLQFGDFNFTELSILMESESTVATEDGKAINTIVFKYENNELYAGVINGKETTLTEKTKMSITPNTDVTISINEVDCGYGEFNLLVNNVKVGTLKNIGANFMEKKTDQASFKVHAKVVAGKTTKVFLKNLNGQSFATNASGEITDDAAPVIVVNEQFNGFHLGSQFALDYKELDVLDSSVTLTKQYYQWNPKDTETKYTTFTNSPYFMDTVYDGTSVFAEEGKEYVSIKFKAKDDASKSHEYDFSWYATDFATKGTVDYVLLTRNQAGATYNVLTLDDVNKKNVKTSDYEQQVATYQETVEKLTPDSSAYVNLPALNWLINDDNGYSNLKFVISYKTPSSTSPKPTSPLSANALKISSSDEGWYEFKVFATDKAGNPMKYYDKDGELVEVTSSNIWDIEEIPSFTYQVKNVSISVDFDKAKASLKTTKVLNETYTFSDPTIVGAKNQQKSYKLYKVDANVTNDQLVNIKFADIVTAAKATEAWKNKNYHEAYKQAYAKRLLGDEVTAATIDSSFKAIADFNSRITEEDETAWNNSDNKFNWNATAGSFTTAEDGSYLIIADYWEKELPQQRAVAYKVVIVDSEADIIKGETEWLQNNIVSVVLFSIAGVMLILIIILLLIKPSDETLEDIDVKAAKKKAAKAKKDKKEN